MSQYDITILTEKQYVAPTDQSEYVQNVMLEDRLVQEALEAKGLKVFRTNWDNPDFDWSSTKAVLFRSIWDYFHRFDEFSEWMEKAKVLTRMINPSEQILWNIDKHYLLDLENKGVQICPSQFIEIGDSRSLRELFDSYGHEEIILKPAISGAARHTYKLNSEIIEGHEAIFRDLIAKESMLIQPFQYKVVSKGEISLMVFGGKYSHAVLKKAKSGDFRVQDDFGGSVHEYLSSSDEIDFAENVVAACETIPAYARVDLIWDNDNQLCVSELELIEPELWFRRNDQAAHLLADFIVKDLI